MKDSPLILIASIFLISVLSLGILANLFFQRKVHNKPKRKRRKRLFIFLCSSILVVISILAGFGTLLSDNAEEFESYLKEALLSKYFIIQVALLIVVFLYAFFRKDKETDKENT